MARFFLRPLRGRLLGVYEQVFSPVGNPQVLSALVESFFQQVRKAGNAAGVVGHKDVVAIGFGEFDPELSEALAEAVEEPVRVVVVAWGHDGDGCDLLHVGSVRLGTQRGRRFKPALFLSMLPAWLEVKRQPGRVVVAASPTASTAAVQLNA